jgi:major membrane immunogen (membrane-anchored lipoprotein)
MKKLVIAAVFVTFCETVMFAQAYKDGFYFAQDSDFASNQKNQVVLEVKGGKITSANWNIESLNAGSQDLKAIARSGSVAGAVTWAGQAKAAEDFLVSSQNTNASSVPGGPANVAPFFNLVKQALASNPVPKGSYKDGWYYALETVTDEYHTRNYILVTVVNGTIVDALWNGVLQGMPQSINPSKMITSRANNYPMLDAQGRQSRTAWHLQSALVSAELVRVQNPDSIKTKSDNRPDAISGATIEIQHFLSVLKQALQTAK